MESNPEILFLIVSAFVTMVKETFPMPRFLKILNHTFFLVFYRSDFYILRVIHLKDRSYINFYLFSAKLFAFCHSISY